MEDNNIGYNYLCMDYDKIHYTVCLDKKKIYFLYIF